MSGNEIERDRRDQERDRRDRKRRNQQAYRDRLKAQSETNLAKKAAQEAQDALKAVQDALQATIAAAKASWDARNTPEAIAARATEEAIRKALDVRCSTCGYPANFGCSHQPSPPSPVPSPGDPVEPLPADHAQAMANAIVGAPSYQVHVPVNVNSGNVFGLTDDERARNDAAWVRWDEEQRREREGLVETLRRQEADSQKRMADAWSRQGTLIR